MSCQNNIDKQINIKLFHLMVVTINIHHLTNTPNTSATFVLISSRFFYKISQQKFRIHCFIIKIKRELFKIKCKQNIKLIFKNLFILFFFFCRLLYFYYKRNNIPFSPQTKHTYIFTVLKFYILFCLYIKFVLLCFMKIIRI